MSPPPKNNNWKWFFAVLILLALFTSVLLVWYNLQQQLKPEQLEAARLLWNAKKPASYTLIYTQTFTGQVGGDSRSNHYVVKVRDRKVVEVLVNGAPKTDRFEYHDMDGLFDQVEQFQERDERDKRRVFRTAIFDPENSAIRRYVRRVQGGAERQQFEVESLQVK